MRTKFGLLAAAVAVLSTAFAAGAQGGPPAEKFPRGTLVDAEGKRVEGGRLLEMLRAADFILVGEQHTSRCDHLAQARLLELMAFGGLRAAVGVEMVGVEQQRALDLFNQRRIPACRLDDALLWGENWGFDFNLYRPIFETAEAFDLPVVALNIPFYLAHMIAEGRIDPQTVLPRNLVPDPVIPPPPEQLARLSDEISLHQQMLGISDGEQALERFAYVQSLWDSQMAEVSLRAYARLERPVVVLAGKGHVERGYGIASRLRALAPGVRILSVLPWRGKEAPEPLDADLFFYCPGE